MNSNNQIEHPLLYSDTADTILINYYFETTLPLLNKDKTNIVIIDNARYHKSKELIQIFEQNNCILKYLPPYSPDLNPIEKPWGTIKKCFRNHANKVLDFETNLINTINRYCEEVGMV